VKATIEPKTTRNAKAPTEPAEIAEQRRGAEHLHRGREERRPRQRRDTAVRGAHRPRECGDEDHGGTDRVDVRARPHEQCDTEQPGCDPGNGAEREADAEELAVEERREERHGGDEKRGQPRGDPLLGQGDAAGVDEQEQPADDRGGRPLAPAEPRRLDVAPPGGPDVQEPAREPEPDREHEQRRQRAVGDGDREIRRSPDDVDDPERDGDPGSHGSMVPRAIDQHKLSYRSYRS
jgi:hypothetical protein